MAMEMWPLGRCRGRPAVAIMSMALMSHGYTFRSLGAAADQARPYADLQLYCAICAAGFIYAAGERQLAQIRGIELQPKICAECRRNAWQRTSN